MLIFVKVKKSVVFVREIKMPLTFLKFKLEGVRVLSMFVLEIAHFWSNKRVVELYNFEFFLIKKKPFNNWFKKSIWFISVQQQNIFSVY